VVSRLKLEIDKIAEIALGVDILDYLSRPETTDIDINPDGRVYVSSHNGEVEIDTIISPERRYLFINAVARENNTVCNRREPILLADFDTYKSRVTGMIPPVSESPCITIRKHSPRIFSLEDYVEDGVLKESQRIEFIDAIDSKKNIVISGSTGAGKTTLVNALLSEISKMSSRVVVLEETSELRCMSRNRVKAGTAKGLGLGELVELSLRLHPERIIVGEVKNKKAALALIEASNTGHPGIITTIHANSPKDAIKRLISLSGSEQRVQDAVDMVAHIYKDNSGHRRLQEIYYVENKVE
jgi:type IV secretion system protein TrbB